MAISSSSREPKWCNSIRWLVPPAGATSRSDRSPTPPPGNSSTSLSSSCRRGLRSGLRTIGTVQLLRPGLESLGFEFEETLGLLDHHPSDQRAEHTTLLELLAYQGAAPGLGHDVLTTPHVHSRGALPPGPGQARVDLGHLPVQLGHAGLFDREPFADSQIGPVAPAQCGD